MISDSCDFDEFILKTNGRDYHDIIYLADREATEAQRRFYHGGLSDDEKTRCGQQYAECLKGFITYLRYGVRPARVDDDALANLQRIRDEALHVKRPAVSV